MTVAKPAECHSPFKSSITASTPTDPALECHNDDLISTLALCRNGHKCYLAVEKWMVRQNFFLSFFPLSARLLCRQFRFQVLVDGISDGLAGCDAHDARRDAFVQRLEALLLEQRAGDGYGVREA